MRLTHEDLMECVQALGVFTSVLALLAPSPTRAQIGQQRKKLGGKKSSQKGSTDFFAAILNHLAIPKYTSRCSLDTVEAGQLHQSSRSHGACGQFIRPAVLSLKIHCTNSTFHQHS